MRSSGLPPVTSLCRIPSPCHQCMSRAFQLSPVRTRGLLSLIGATVALCLSLACAECLLPVSGLCHWTVACHQCVPAACLLLSECAGVLMPVAGLHRGLPPLTSMLQWPATCFQHMLVNFCLSLSHDGALPPVTRVCRFPSACNWCVPLAFCLSPVHASGLPPFTGMHRWPSLSHRCIPLALCLSPVHACGLLPVISMCRCSVAGMCR